MYSEQIKILLQKSGVFLSKEEINSLEFTDFGLADFAQIGLIIHTYVNTQRCCAKELFLLPNQTCPEHQHPSLNGKAGKEETFRCRFGTVSLFIAGVPTIKPTVSAPKLGQQYYSVKKEYVLNRGNQVTLSPDTLHWFKAHDEGAVISEFSTHSDDSSDIFTNPNIKRLNYLY